MTLKDKRGPGEASRHGGDYDSSNNSAMNPAVSPFGQLTARLVMAQHRAGTLNPAVVEALLISVGLEP